MPMKKILVLVCLCLFPFTASAANRSLVCKSIKGQITFDICGVHGCPAEILDLGITKNYLFTRTRTSDNGLKYASKTGTPKCTVVITPLSKGVRSVRSAGCAKDLKGAHCTFHD